MDKFKNAKESLESTISTIFSCDNKASFLLTAIGVVFGFSLFSVTELANKTGIIKLLIIIFGTLYLGAFLTTIIVLVLIVFPRSKNKVEKTRQIDYKNYSEDIYKHLKLNDINSFVTQDAGIDEVIDQVKICARIAHTKANLLKAATVLIILFATFLICLAVCLFI